MYDPIQLSSAFERPALLKRGGRYESYLTRRATDGEPVVLKRFMTPAWLSRDERDALLNRLSVLPAWLREKDAEAILPVCEVWREDRSVTFLRPYAAGESLEVAISRSGDWSRAEIERFARPLGAALDALNARGRRHGAVTAGNVILQTTGGVLLTDACLRNAWRSFGVASARCGLGAPGSEADDIAQMARLCRIAAGRLMDPQLEAVLRSACGRGRNGFTGAELAEAIAPKTNAALFQIAWKPAAAIGLAGALVTVGATGYTRQTEPETGPMRSPAAPKTVLPAEPVPAATEHRLPVLATTDRDALELAVRRKGVTVLAHPVVADAFDLSEAQREAVRIVLNRGREKTARLIERVSRGETVDINEEMRLSRQAAEAAVLRHLDNAQKNRWTELETASHGPGEPIL